MAVPLHSAEHFYVVTKPLEPKVPQSLPVMRDLVPDAVWGARSESSGVRILFSTTASGLAGC